MKKYIIKPEYIDNFGSEANAMTIIDSKEVERLAEEWGMKKSELREWLIEQKPSTRTPIHRFAGRYGWEELNYLISFDSGNPEDFFQDEEDYKQAILEGFVDFDGYYTTIYED